MGRSSLFRPSQELRELELLQELEKNPIVSQRELSNKFGSALGVTNACLKEMVQKEWIRIMILDHHKTGYYLTLKGLGEKARLTLRLISWTMEHYSTLKEIIGRRLLEMQRSGIERIVFYGVGDEMEVALAALQRTSLKLVGIVEDEDRFVPQIVFGYEIEPVGRVNDLRPDSILITAFAELETRRERLEKLVNKRLIPIHDICS